MEVIVQMVNIRGEDGPRYECKVSLGENFQVQFRWKL
jgi:hypothetical protein